MNDYIIFYFVIGFICMICLLCEDTSMMGQTNSGFRVKHIFVVLAIIFAVPWFLGLAAIAGILWLFLYIGNIKLS